MSSRIEHKEIPSVTSDRYTIRENDSCIRIASRRGAFQVGWLRTSDQTILSIHTRIVTHNARITVTYESGASSGSAGASGGASGVTGSSQATEEIVDGTWRLHIRQLKETDRDCYMCQINTSPMISELGCLDIHGKCYLLSSVVSHTCHAVSRE